MFSDVARRISKSTGTLYNHAHAEHEGEKHVALWKLAFGDSTQADSQEKPSNTERYSRRHLVKTKSAFLHRTGERKTRRLTPKRQRTFSFPRRLTPPQPQRSFDVIPEEEHDTHSLLKERGEKKDGEEEDKEDTFSDVSKESVPPDTSDTSRNYETPFEPEPYCDAQSYFSPELSKDEIKGKPNSAETNEEEEFRCTHKDFCQYCQEEMRGYPRDWNNEFQSLLELPTNSEEERLRRFELLHNLSQDFSTTAQMYGKIIISEAFLPRKYQTIKPCEVGGLAGGKKYIYNGIFFKFALDSLGLYGSDENAMKAAAHDLKGLARYSDIPGLSVPLMQIIDYRGFRLVALSILPIEESTLVYGSSDGGRTVYTSNARMNAYMQVAANKLNLKGHMGGSEQCEEKKMIHGATDIEGHVGLDGRLYVLDFARIFPPTTPSKNKRNCYLYELMRPEFVKKNNKPLSSDAFSPFGVDCASEHNEEVKEATNKLLHQVVPKFARWLMNTKMQGVENRLSTHLHRKGINVRYIGKVRFHTTDCKLKQMCLNEMIARIVKISFKRRLRKKTKSLRHMSESACKEVAKNLFNLVLGWPKEKSDRFWANLKRKIMEKFGHDSLTSEEKQDNFDLRQTLVLPKLLLHVQRLCGVQFSQQQSEDLNSMIETEDSVNPPGKYNSMSGCKIVTSDIDKIPVRVTNMDVLSLAESNALVLQSKQETGEVASRLFKRARQLFEMILMGTPDSYSTQNNYADALIHQALRLERELTTSRQASLGLSSHCDATNVTQRDPSDILTRCEDILQLFGMGVALYINTKNWYTLELIRRLLESRYHHHDHPIYATWDLKQRLFITLDKIWTSLTTHPIYQSSYEYYCWGRLLATHAWKYKPQTNSMDLYERAGSTLRRALELDPQIPWLLGQRKKEEYINRKRFFLREGFMNSLLEYTPEFFQGESENQNSPDTPSLASPIPNMPWLSEKSKSTPSLNIQMKRTTVGFRGQKAESAGLPLMNLFPSPSPSPSVKRLVEDNKPQGEQSSQKNESHKSRANSLRDTFNSINDGNNAHTIELATIKEHEMLNLYELFQQNDLKQMKNKDIACMIEILDGLMQQREGKSKKEPLQRSIDDSRKENTAQNEKGDTIQKKEKKSESEETVKPRLKGKIINMGGVELNFETMCYQYTEHAVRSLLRCIGAEVVTIHLPPNPNISDLTVGDIARYCHKLKRLSINHCPAIYKIGALPSTLESLVLQGNDLTDDMVASVSLTCTNLCHLELITSPPPSSSAFESHDGCVASRGLTSNALRSIIGLTTSSVSEVAPDPQPVDNLQSTPRGLTNCLTKLKLVGCNQPTFIGSLHLLSLCKALRSLDLRRCISLDDNSLLTILKGIHITSLRLDCCEKITDLSLFGIASNCMSSITKLHLSHCPKITDQGLQATVDSCLLLISLGVLHCSGMSNFAITLPSFREFRSFKVQACSVIHNVQHQHFQRLNKMRLFDCAFADDTFLASFASSHMGNLTKITLSGKGMITDSGVRCLIKAIPLVKSLALLKCENLTDEAVLEITGLRYLKDLSITGNQRITDDAMVIVMSSGLHIKRLNLSGCTQISDRLVLSIASQCSCCHSLQILDLSHCSKVGNSSVAVLWQKSCVLKEVRLTG